MTNEFIKNKLWDGFKLTKENIFCPKCGKKKVYYIYDHPDYTHFCVVCETSMIIKGFVI